MNDATASRPVVAAPPRRDFGLKARYRAERRFRAYGIASILFGLVFLVLLMWTIFAKGYSAFVQTTLTFPIAFEEKVIDPSGKRVSDPNVLAMANYPKLARDSLAAKLGVNMSDSAALKEVAALISDGVALGSCATLWRPIRRSSGRRNRSASLPTRMSIPSSRARSTSTWPNRTAGSTTARSAGSTS